MALMLRDASLVAKVGEHSATAQTSKPAVARPPRRDRPRRREGCLSGALTICETTLGREHPATAQTLYNLAGLLQAERAYLRLPQLGAHARRKALCSASSSPG